ncbi:D-glycero-alpha-D-manno-heptose 1-phosphate guanylyltransferase [Gammaproteobacteria bacterium]
MIINKKYPQEAVILAGGLGTRLRPIVNDCPKCLAKIHGRPFITYLMDQIADAGISRVILCVGYMEAMMKTVLGSCYRSMELLYSTEQYPLGTGGALRLALSLLQTDSVIVMNGDSFCDLDLSEMFTVHKTRSAKLSIAVTSIDDVGRYGKVSMNSLGQITKFEEKGCYSGDGYINSGIYVINQEIIIKMIPAEQSVSLEKTIFPTMIDYGLYGFLTQGKFIDIGIPVDYFRAQNFFEKYSK